MLVVTLYLATQVSVPQLLQEYLEELYLSSPMTANKVGYHKDGVDRRLDDVSPAARSRRVAFLRGLADRLKGLDRKNLSANDVADARLLDENVALELLSLEHAKDFARRPDLYVGALGEAFFNMARPYAPLDQRGEDVAVRLGEIPRYLAQAQQNLTTYVDAFVQAAVEDGHGLAEFLHGELAHTFAKSAANAKIQAALPRAEKAINDFLAFASGPLQKMPAGSWRYGKELYNLRFPHYLQTELTPDAVYQRAQQRLAEIKQEMRDLARKLYPQLKPGVRLAKDADVVRLTLAEIAKEHSTPAGLFEQAKEDVKRQIAWVRRKKLLTLPPTSKLQVLETPPFMRSLYGVAGFDGAPPLTPDVGAFYYVTPFPKDWPKEKAESKLREYNKWKMELISIHEAIPGHFVQFQYANRVQPEVRRVARWLLNSTAYVEGWAAFAEDLMVSSGYLAGPKMRLTYLKGLLRVVANSMLDVGLHSRGMTEAQAMALMMDDTYQEKTEAELKLRRARLDVTQLCSYFVGYEEWRGLRDELKQANGPTFEQRAFLDRALSYGGVALPSLRKLMLDK
jgi:uncharacterized protein (DUF885 family)